MRIPFAQRANRGYGTKTLLEPASKLLIVRFLTNFLWLRVYRRRLNMPQRVENLVTDGYLIRNRKHCRQITFRSPLRQDPKNESNTSLSHDTGRVGRKEPTHRRILDRAISETTEFDSSRGLYLAGLIDLHLNDHAFLPGFPENKRHKYRSNRRKHLGPICFRSLPTGAGTLSSS